jgi:hypothetical protein
MGDSHVEAFGTRHVASDLVKWLGGSVNEDGSVEVGNEMAVYAPDGSYMPAWMAADVHGYDFAQREYKPGASPTLDPTQDPTFLAFQRAQGSAEADLRREIANAISTGYRRAASETARLDEGLDDDLEDTAMDYAARGAFASSGRLKTQDKVQRDVERRKAALQEAAADDESALQSQLAATLRQNEYRLSQESEAARGRVSTQAAKTEAARRAAFDAEEGTRHRNFLMSHRNPSGAF